MKLYEHFAKSLSGKAFHSTVVTTFGIEFTAFEQVLMPQFLGAGAGNIVLLADPGMVALTLAEGAAPPKTAGVDYIVHSPRSQGGVFHPKIIFQVGRDGARVVVGSANATSSGLAGNREVVSCVECSAAPSPERAFAVAVWHYLADLVEQTPGPVHDALLWLEKYTPWLAQAEDDRNVRTWTLADGSHLGFMANAVAEERSIVDRFVAEIGESPVERLLVMSPYWDEGLVPLRLLIGALNPSETVVLIQSNEERFPTQAALSLDLVVKELSVSEAVGAQVEGSARRFSHAKLIIATAGDYDYVLSGSANCTLAALGTRQRRGGNAEACIYRRLPAGGIVSDLKLDTSLTAPPLNLDDLPPLYFEPDLPLAAAAASWPGAFELDYEHLVWRPADAIDPSLVNVVLLDDPAGTPLANITPGDWLGGEGYLSIRLREGMGKARFARVVGPAGASGLAIVAHREELRARRKERHTRGTEKIVEAMREVGGLDMKLLELMTLLEKADVAADGAVARPMRMARSEKGGPDALAPVQLGYDAFLRIRRSETEGGKGSGGDRNSLAGSSLDFVRSFLNNLSRGGLGVNLDVILEEELEENITEGTMPRLPGTSGHPQHVRWGDGVGARPPARAQIDAAILEKAVDKYWVTVRAQALAGSIGSGHVIRLRLWMMLLLGNRDQLVCDASNTGWPRLIVRVMAAFFTGPQAPIKNLAIESRYDRIPDDFIEAWVAVLAALDTLKDSATLISEKPGGEAFVRHIGLLDASVRPLIGLTAADLKHGFAREAGDELRAFVGVTRAEKLIEA